MPAASKSKSAKKGKKSAVAVKKQVPVSTRAGLIMPVPRFLTMMKRDRLQNTITKNSAIAMSAAVEYALCEILEIAGNIAQEQNKKRIGNRHILLAIKGDEELNKLFRGITIAEGGVLPHIDQRLLPAKKGGKAHLSQDATQPV